MSKVLFSFQLVRHTTKEAVVAHAPFAPQHMTSILPRHPRAPGWKACFSMKAPRTAFKQEVI